VKIKNILITGLPGIGKTTLIKRLSEAFSPFSPIGFYTAEIIYLKGDVGSNTT